MGLNNPPAWSVSDGIPPLAGGALGFGLRCLPGGFVGLGSFAASGFLLNSYGYA